MVCILAKCRTYLCKAKLKLAWKNIKIALIKDRVSYNDVDAGLQCNL